MAPKDARNKPDRSRSARPSRPAGGKRPAPSRSSDSSSPSGPSRGKRPSSTRSSNSPRSAGPPRSKGPFKPRSGSKPPFSGSPHRAHSNQRGPSTNRDRINTGRVRLVHEDEQFFIVDKPAGLPVYEESDAPCVVSIVCSILKKQGINRPNILASSHLDTDASGLVLLSKNKYMFEKLRTQGSKGTIDRTFIAVTEGHIPPPPPLTPATPSETDDPSPISKAQADLACATIQSDLVMDRHAKVSTLPPGSPRQHHRFAAGPWGATTLYRICRYSDDAPSSSKSGLTLVRLTPRTDVPDQLRVHMADLGHAIIGDDRYGTGPHTAEPLALHLTDLSFIHPNTAKRVHYISKPPKQFDDLINSPPPGLLNEPEVDQSAEKPAVPGSWDNVADWYDRYLSSDRSDHHDQIILPGVEQMLNLSAGKCLLDVCCGQGILCARLSTKGIKTVGVDSSEHLIHSARQRTPEVTNQVRFVLGDVRDLNALDLGSFDAAACVLAMMNVDPIKSVFAGVAEHLKPGSPFVIVLMHPAFRSPRCTSWGWNNDATGKVRQFRRVDGYLSDRAEPIVMNPGAVAHNKQAVTTTTHHRPIHHYINALGATGFMVDAMEEWASKRRSTSGPRAAEENRARAEIPLFLAIRAIRTNSSHQI